MDPKKNLLTKVYIFWEVHKILRNLHQLFVPCTASQIVCGELSYVVLVKSTVEISQNFMTFLENMNFIMIIICLFLIIFIPS